MVSGTLRFLFGLTVLAFLTIAAIAQPSSMGGMGRNYSGQLGDGTWTNRTTPTYMTAGVVWVSAGFEYSTFVKTDGTLWAMGENSYGQLGDGTTNIRATPVRVATGVASVSAGYQHTLFLKTDGTLWAMGANTHGQLGDGTTTNRSIPVQVDTGVASVSAGRFHSVFVKTDGTLWGMGMNGSGQLGSGYSAKPFTPVQIATGVVSASAGGFSDATADGGHTLFVKIDGTLWAMGANAYGQLGDGTTTKRSIPVQVDIGVVSISAGGRHSMFVKTDGSLWAMGDNYYGQLGAAYDAVASFRTIPVQVATGVALVFAGSTHTLFVKTDGSLWAVGENRFGEFGLGARFVGNNYNPVKVAAEVVSASAGESHTPWWERFIRSPSTLAPTAPAPAAARSRKLF